MKMSEQINELAEALAKAQGSLENASKDRENPHFRSRYSDLASVREAVRMPFSDNGLSYVQFLRWSPGVVEVETMLMHKSGQFLSDTLPVPVMKNDAQAVGSAATYGRRYSLMAVAGIAPDDDDDGNAAAQGTPRPNGSAAPRPPAPPVAFSSGPAAPPAPTAQQEADAREIEEAFDSAETLAALDAIRVELTADIEKLPEALKTHLRRVYGLKRKVLETFSEAAE
jgi:hypothetical protein